MMKIAASPRRWRGTTGLALGAGILLAFGSFSAVAAPQHADDGTEIRAELQALRAEQARIAEIQERTAAAIRALEERLGVAAPAEELAPPPPVPAPTIAQAAVAPAQPERLKVGGDLRLRTQFDRAEGSPDRTSGQLRGRLGATWAFNDRLTLGARLVTGNSDDPNSTDVQLSNWLDDLEVSLDLAYARLDLGDWQFFGGKFPQPFQRTDLVWDGDVNPQGLATSWNRKLDGGGTLRAAGTFFVIDEDGGGSDSTMAGVQFGYASPGSGMFRYGVSGAYYHYSLGSLVGADSGDWRTNRLRPDGSFLSDYHLANLLVDATWSGSNPKWPVRVVGDYVRNLGAIDDEDTGYGLDVSLGRASKPGDWRFTYGYSQTDVDAVMAAFSHDNIGIATNYKLHSLTLDYTPMPQTAITAIWYHYKPNNPAFAGPLPPGDWLDRFRLFFLMNF